MQPVFSPCIIIAPPADPGAVDSAGFPVEIAEA